MNYSLYICTRKDLSKNNDMDILSRLISFRDYTQLTNSQFADLARIPRPTLSQFLSGRNKRLSDELATKLHIAFPNLNMMWLLFGEGDMLLDPNIEISEGKIEDFNDETPTLSIENQQIASEPSLLDIITKSEAIQNNDAGKSTNSRAELGEFEKVVPNVTKTASNKSVKFVMVVYSDFSNEVFVPSTQKNQ